MKNVVNLFGDEPVPPEPNQSAIRMLSAVLAQAERGEVIGVVISSLHSDRSASYGIAGMIGPYSLVGAMEIAKDEVIGSVKVMQR